MRRTNEIPDSERMIIVYDDDYTGDFTFKGKFVDYKKPIKKGKKTLKSRFFKLVKGQFESDHAAFRTAKGWEYASEPLPERKD